MMEFIVSSEYKVAPTIWEFDEDFVDLKKTKITKWIQAAGYERPQAMGFNLVLTN